MLRRWIEDLLERFFPGMGWRPLYLTASATWLLVLYHYHGGTSDAPAWWIEGCDELLGIGVEAFYRHLWSHACAVSLLMVAPLLICWFGEGWTPRQLGFRIRGAGPELAVVLGLWVVMIPLVYLVHTGAAFQRVYPRLEAADTSMRLYVLFECFYLAKWIAWEFFFRGFMLFGFQRDFLRRSVLISTIPFVLMHVGKPEIEMASALIAGLVLSFIALRSKSIWPGVLLHWLVASTMDFMASSFWR